MATLSPLRSRVIRTAALIQSALLDGAPAHRATSLVLAQRDQQSESARTDPYYPRGLGVAVWGTLTVLTLGALLLVVVPTLRLHRGKRRASGVLVTGELITLVPVAVTTGATLHHHYFGLVTWLLIAYDLGAAALLLAVGRPRTPAARDDHVTREGLATPPSAR